MPTILILANIELRGFGINLPALQELSIVIKNDLSSIEENAFNLAGRKFNFYSSKDVAQVRSLLIRFSTKMLKTFTNLIYLKIFQGSGIK